MITVKVKKEYRNEEEKKLALKKAMDEFARKNEKDLINLFIFKTGIYDRDIVHDAVYEFYLRMMKSASLLSYGELEDSYYRKDSKGNFIKVDVSKVEMASFETYITNLFYYLLPGFAKKNFRNMNVPVPKESEKWYTGSAARDWVKEEYVVKKNKNNRVTVDYPIISNMPVNNEAWVEYKDVFELVHKNNAKLKVSSAYESSLFDDTVDPATTGYIESFKEYIRRTENPKTAKKMITYLDKKLEGCCGVEIAAMIDGNRLKTENKKGISDNMVKLIKQDIQKKYEKWQGVQILKRVEIEA